MLLESQQNPNPDIQHWSSELDVSELDVSELDVSELDVSELDVRENKGSKAMRQIRRATIGDALGIHKAHMRSIQEVCSKIHTAEEIRGWGNRAFDPNMWERAIVNDFVWVVDNDGRIEGYGHLRIYQPDDLSNDGKVPISRKQEAPDNRIQKDKLRASIRGLYLVPEAIGQGLGLKLLNLMLKTTELKRVIEVSLASTLTAHSFYLKVGFEDSGPHGKVSIGGSDVRYIPMRLKDSVPSNSKITPGRI